METEVVVEVQDSSEKEDTETIETAEVVVEVQNCSEIEDRISESV